MKHLVLAILYCLIVFLIVFSGLLIINRSQPVVTCDQQVHISEKDKQIVLFPWKTLDDGNYHLKLAEKDKDSFLVLSAMRPYTVKADGVEINHYSPEDRYQRLHILPIPKNCNELILYPAQGQKSLKALITSSPYNMLSFSRNLSTLIIGMHISILIFCIILFLNKPSETYLLAECVAVATSLISAFLTSGEFVLPVSERNYVYIQNLMDALRFPVLYSICILILPVSRFQLIRFYRNHIIAITSVMFLIFFILNTFHLQIVSSVISQLLWLISAFACAEALSTRTPCMSIFTGAYLVRFGLNSYVSLCNDGYLPNTALQVYFYIPQLSNLIFIISCMYVVAQRFASQYKAAETLSTQLTQMNMQLDHLVEQRTSELVEQQQKRKNMMINIFHDIRSPLFSVRGCFDMMKPHDQDDVQLQSIITSRLDFLSKMVEQLFLAAKLEDDQITFVFDPIDINALIQHLCQEFESQFSAKSIRLISNRSLDPVIIIGDAFRIKQALDNILSNAVNFTPQNGTVCINIFEYTDHVIISIADNGVGIPPEDLPYVFSRYYQGKNSNKHSSSGLGLSIAKEIIVKHGGSISVKSDDGTVFNIILPKKI